MVLAKRSGGLRSISMIAARNTPDYARFRCGLTILPAVVLVFAAFSFVNPATAETEYRSWSSPDGREIRAKLEHHDLDSGTVRLRLEQGRDVELGYGQLSDADVGFLAELAHRDGEEIIRAWTSSEGTEILARWINPGGEFDTVTLRRVDGLEFDLVPDRLSDVDRAHIAERAEAIREAREKAMAEVAELAGKTIRYQTATDEPRTYHVFYPPTYSPLKPSPMLLLFSPGGGTRGMIRNFTEPATKLGWVVVGCDGPRNGQAMEIGSKMVADMLPEIEKTVAFHDSQQLYVSGFSGGAIRAFRTVSEHDRPWKGVISLGGWMGRNPENLKLSRGLAVAWVNGDKDRGANTYVSRDSALVKGKTKLFDFPGGHVIGPSDVLEQAMIWVRENGR